MNTSLSLLPNRTGRIALGALLVPFLLTSLFAQTQTGTITGRVFGESSGNALQGAVVSVSGGTAFDYTDDQGRFIDMCDCDQI